MSICKFKQTMRQLQKMHESLGNAANQKFERGMVTAEYALGTVATTGIAGVLIWLAQQDWLRDLIANLFKQLISAYL